MKYPMTMWHWQLYHQIPLYKTESERLRSYFALKARLYGFMRYTIPNSKQVRCTMVHSILETCEWCDMTSPANPICNACLTEKYGL